MTTAIEVRKLRRADRLLLRLQSIIPYQGNGSLEEVEAAIESLASSQFRGGIPGFPPILKGRECSSLQAALAVCYKTQEVLAGEGNLLAVSQTLIAQTARLLSYSTPSLLPTLSALTGALPQREQITMRAWQWCGDSAHYLKQYEQAQIAYERLLELATASGSRPSVAHAHRGLGDCAFKRADFACALGFYEKAHAEYRQARKQPSLVRVLRNLADAKRGLGQVEAADRIYAKSIRLGRQLGPKWNLAKALQERGWNAWLRGDLDEARTYFQEALTEYGPLRRSRGRFTCWFALARLFNNRELIPEALSPTGEEQEMASLLGHRPWRERGHLLGFGRPAACSAGGR